MRIKLSIFLCLLFYMQQGHAFKINTHAFIGQEVINDIEDDGRVTIPNGEGVIHVTVPVEVKNAILSNKNYYLMGTMGPDATPDVVVGQTVVHPGSGEGDENRWEVSGWLDYLSRTMTSTEKEKAFYYGYLSHVSADVFAHTYVNQYTGDVFLLSDGETLAELRHIALEGYIDGHTPPFRNLNKNIIADSAFELIKLDDDYGAMIRDKLITNNEVHQQYKKSAFATHLVAYKNARDEVSNIAESSLWGEIDREVLKFIAEYYYGYQLSDGEADKLLSGTQKFKDFFEGKVVDYLQNFENRTYENLKKWEQLGFTAIVKKIRDAQALEAKIRSKKQQIDQTLVTFDSELRHSGCDFTADAVKVLDPTGITSTLADGKFITNSIIDPVKAANQLLGNVKDSWAFEQSCKTVSVSGVSCNWLGICLPKKWFEKVCSNPQPYLNHSTAFNKKQFLSHQFTQSQVIKDVDLAKATASWNKALTLAFSLLPQDTFVPISGDIMIPLMLDSEAVMSVSLTLDHLSIYRSKNYADYNQGRKTLVYQYDTAAKTVKSNDIAFCHTINNSIDNVTNESVKLIHKLENETALLNNSLIQKHIDIRNESVKAIDELHTIGDLVIDINQMLIQDVSPIQSFLHGWVDELDDAMLQYTIAASQSMLNTTNAQAGGELPFEPMITWFNDYHLSLINGQKVGAVLTSTRNLLDSLNKIKKLSTIDPLGDRIDSEITKLEEKAKNIFKDKLTDKLTQFLPDDMQELMQWMINGKISDELLNQAFTTAEGELIYKGLIMIPDISDRVKREMNLVNGKFDPQKYNVIKNAITLSKLSLLDNKGLKELVRALGVSEAIVGNTDNLVKGAFNNIDANHQWMAISPPLPRDAGYSVITGKTYANEGFSYSSDSGFMLWGNNTDRNEELRNKLFRSIFKGPLNLGIDAPELLNMPKIVTDEYQSIYKPMEEFGFPSLK